MTENEAIKDLDYAEAEREIQRLISYIRSCRESDIDCTVTIDKSLTHVVLGALAEIQQYWEIGTVKECREAVEKQKPKKPTIGADFMVGRDDEGKTIWEHDYVCPECGLGIAGEYMCCPYCGTYIDWSEEE